MSLRQLALDLGSVETSVAASLKDMSELLRTIEEETVPWTQTRRRRRMLAVTVLNPASCGNETRAWTSGRRRHMGHISAGPCESGGHVQQAAGLLLSDAHDIRLHGGGGPAQYRAGEKAQCAAYEVQRTWATGRGAVAARRRHQVCYRVDGCPVDRAQRCSGSCRGALRAPGRRLHTILRSHAGGDIRGAGGQRGGDPRDAAAAACAGHCGREQRYYEEQCPCLLFHRKPAVTKEAFDGTKRHLPRRRRNSRAP